MSLLSLFDPAAGALWLLIAYATTLNATLFLAGMGVLAFLARRESPALRAAVWTLALLGVLGVALLAQLPGGGWLASQLPGSLAAPMVTLGAARIAAGTESGAAAVWWVVALRGLWLAGALFVLARLLWGWGAIRASTRRATPVREREWLTLLEEAAARLGIRRPVELRRSLEAATPLTWGTLRPVILLPAAAREWSVEHRRAVLLHELAHVKRQDCLLQVLGQISCALYWFHPAVWWAAERLRIAREMACDAQVLGAGVRPSDYAQCLLSLAECARPGDGAGSVAVAVGMARPSRLKERMMVILGRPPHRRSSRLRGTAIGVCAVVLVLTTGNHHLSPRSDTLLRALTDEQWSTRAFAAVALSSWRAQQDPELAATARRIAESDPHPAVRRSVQDDFRF